MVISKKYLIAFFLFFLFAIPLVALGIISYKPILNVSPQYIELEIQDYYLTFAIIFSLYSLLFWISFKRKIGNLFKRYSLNMSVSRFILFSVALIESLYLCYFYFFTYPLINMTPSFRDIGITVDDNFAIPILLLIIVLTVAIFLLLIRSGRRAFSLIVFQIGVALTILLTFKISELNPVDFAYFAGPINDVLHGKYLLYNSPSQYGFLSIIFLSVIFKFIPLGLMNLTIVNAVIVTLGFILVFILMQFLYKNRFLSLFALIFIIFLNHTIQIVPNLIILQTSFVRFGMWVILALSLCLKEYYRGAKYKKLVGIMLYIILVISLFWNLDNGLYIIFAYLAYKSFNNLKPGFLLSIKSILIEFLKVGISVVAGFISIFFIYKLLWGITPNWNYFISDPALYLAGFGLLPLPDSSWHWFIMGVYLLIFTYLIVIKRFRKNSKLTTRENIISFILFYGVFQFSYYMGRSHLNNLHHIIIPFLICLFFVIEHFLELIKKTGKASYYFWGSLICALFIALPMYFIFVQGIKNITAYNLFTSISTIKQKKLIEKNSNDGLIGQSTVQEIKNKYGDYLDKNGITIISIKDTWYLIALNRANNIESNNLGYYVIQEPLQKIANSVIYGNNQYIFVDVNMTENFGQVQSIYNIVKNYYKEKERIGSLLVFERI